MAAAPITLLYDDGRFFQDCLTLIRRARELGHYPTSVRMNADSAKIILDQCEHPFKKNARVFIMIGDLPVKLTAAIADNYVLLDYET